MPSLICSSRYTIDSQILRQSAQLFGWETLRLDGNQIPDWFDPPDEEIAFFYTPPHVFDIASQLGRIVVGCTPDWTIKLPPELLRRELIQTTLAEAIETIDNHFVKHAISKAFPAAVYDSDSLVEATARVHPDSLVHVGEPVRWTDEYRCFVADGKVMTVSPYVVDGVIVTDDGPYIRIPNDTLKWVRQFAQSVLDHDDVDSPEAFVLDVGKIDDRGWAVIECNECWASGIYTCDAEFVLRTLLRGNVRDDSSGRSKWDFAESYRLACPDTCC